MSTAPRPGGVGRADRTGDAARTATAPALASRRVALDLFGAASRGGRPFDDSQAEHPGFAALEPRDRAFVRNLVATAFRRRGQIEALVGSYISRPLPAGDAPVADILHLGVTQLIFLGTPSHAAVDTSVRLVEAIGRPRFKGLVNAVLRRVVREAAAQVERQDEARLNTPDWLWRAWLQQFGAETTRAIALAHLKEAPLDLSVRSDAAGWAQRLGAHVLPTGSLRREGGGLVRELPGYAEGAWWVQDAAAALPARLLGDVDGLRVADLCAAPGGKTLQLAAAGAHVTAVDVAARRLERVAANLRRTRLEAELVAADVLAWQPPAPFDAVLLDAPCTATGTLRRHPDGIWRKRPDDVSRLAELQRQLLLRMAPMLKPGGRLVYAVCSLQIEEGERQIDLLLQSGAPLEIDPVLPAELPGLEEAVTGPGFVRTLPSQWPELGGLDGFFMARLRRR